jgi:hypothetical protein
MREMFFVETAWVAFERKADAHVVENIENGWNSKEALERAVMRVKQAL